MCLHLSIHHIVADDDDIQLLAIDLTLELPLTFVVNFISRGQHALGRGDVQSIGYIDWHILSVYLISNV